MEEYAKADKRKNLIIHGMNSKYSNKNELMNEWINNKFGEEIRVMSCWHDKNGVYAARFNSLEDKIQIMYNSKGPKGTRIYNRSDYQYKEREIRRKCSQIMETVKKQL